MSGFFERLSDKAGTCHSAEALRGEIAAMFDEMADFPGWTFVPESEQPAAFDLARQAPDALIQSVYEWNSYLAARGRRPRRYGADYFAMKRMVAEALATRYPAPAHPPEVPLQDAPLRVAIWVPWLPNNPNNNIMRVVAGYLGGLLKQGDVTAAMVLTNEFSHPAGSTLAHARTDPRQHRSLLEGVIGEYDAPPETLYMAPPPFVEEGNLAWHMAFAEEFRPNAIFVPNFEMSSVHIHGQAKRAATVYLQTSVRNRPPYDFTRYLYLGEKRQIDDSHIHPGKWYYHSFGYGNFGAGSGLTRKDIGLAEDAFVAVTAGNRLEREVDPEITGLMGDLMEANPRVVWMLMGVQKEALIRETLGARFEAMADRVICNGYVREIGDYLSLSDVYVNPRRTGGAVSMALAVYGHTPVISFAGNDACNFLVDEMIHDTPESYGAKLAELAGDAGDLDRIDTAQRARFEANHTIEASAADLVTHVRAAQADWTAA